MSWMSGGGRLVIAEMTPPLEISSPAVAVKETSKPAPRHHGANAPKAQAKRERRIRKPTQLAVRYKRPGYTTAAAQA